MDWDDWIEVDNHYLRFHADKTRRLAERAPKCVKVDPDPRVYDGTLELLEELTAYLTERYPSMFARTPVGLDNLLTGEKFDTRAAHLTVNDVTESPMQLCARLVQDDLAIMFEKPDGQYYLLAGAILLAGFWRLEDKFGMPLSDIHTSGDVPGFKAKLEKGMMSFFRRGLPQSGPKTPRTVLGGLQRRRTKRSSTTTSAQSGSRCVDCRGAEAWCLRLGRISTR
jgi:alpha-1,2-mannosyltransferase